MSAPPSPQSPLTAVSVDATLSGSSKIEKLVGTTDVEGDLSGVTIKEEIGVKTIRPLSGSDIQIRSSGASTQPVQPSTSSTVKLSGQSIELYSGRAGIADFKLDNISGGVYNSDVTVNGNLTVNGTTSIPAPAVNYKNPSFSADTGVDTVLTCNNSTVAGATSVGSVQTTQAGEVKLYDGLTAEPTLSVESSKTTLGPSSLSLNTLKSSPNADFLLTSGAGSSSKLILSTQEDSTEGISTVGNLVLQDRDLRIYDGTTATPQIKMDATNFEIDKDVSITGTVIVGGSTTVGGTLDVTSTGTFSGNVQIDGDLVVNGSTSISIPEANYKNDFYTNVLGENTVLACNNETGAGNTGSGSVKVLQSGQVELFDGLTAEPILVCGGNRTRLGPNTSGYQGILGSFPDRDLAITSGENITTASSLILSTEGQVTSGLGRANVKLNANQILFNDGLQADSIMRVNSRKVFVGPATGTATPNLRSEDGRDFAINSGTGSTKLWLGNNGNSNEGSANTGIAMQGTDIRMYCGITAEPTINLFGSKMVVGPNTSGYSGLIESNPGRDLIINSGSGATNLVLSSSATTAGVNGSILVNNNSVNIYDGVSGSVNLQASNSRIKIGPENGISYVESVATNNMVVTSPAGRSTIVSANGNDQFLDGGSGAIKVDSNGVGLYCNSYAFPSLLMSNSELTLDSPGSFSVIQAKNETTLRVTSEGASPGDIWISKGKRAFGVSHGIIISDLGIGYYGTSGTPLAEMRERFFDATTAYASCNDVGSPIGFASIIGTSGDDLVWDVATPSNYITLAKSNNIDWRFTSGYISGVIVPVNGLYELQVTARTFGAPTDASVNIWVGSSHLAKSPVGGADSCLTATCIARLGAGDVVTFRRNAGTSDNFNRLGSSFIVKKLPNYGSSDSRIFASGTTATYVDQ